MLNIVFQNEDFFIIDKPKGLVAHPFDFSSEKTLIDFLQESHPEVFSIINEKKLQDGRIINLGGIVHKLDRDTSGIMVVAKNQKTFDDLSKQFKEHTIKKTYIAKVKSVVEKDNFIIDAPLSREKKGYRQVVNPENGRGELRKAITEVKVLERGENYTIVELSPKTGRTHQLRAHMKYIGHPIIGDKIYGDKEGDEELQLHAKSLGFELVGEKYFFETK